MPGSFMASGGKRNWQKVLSGRQYQDGRWTSGVGKAVHSLHGVPACLSPGGDTVWKNDMEEGAVPVDRLLIGYRDINLSFNRAFSTSSRRLRAIGILCIPMMSIFPSMACILLVCTM